jgi:hypothetical protein
VLFRSLQLRGGVNGPTDLAVWPGLPAPLTITDGSVTITPEPTSLVLGLFAVAGLGIMAIRKWRQSLS